LTELTKSGNIPLALGHVGWNIPDRLCAQAITIETTDTGERFSWMQLVKNTLIPIGSGLFIAQLIATGFVYKSNLEVHQMVLAAQANGYIAIPYGEAAATLTSWRPAILGGLFYTLSIGVGLTLITWALWHFWDRVFQKRRRSIIGINLFWAAIIVYLLWPSLSDFLNTIRPDMLNAINTKWADHYRKLFFLSAGLVFIFTVWSALTVSIWTLWNLWTRIFRQSGPSIVIPIVLLSSLIVSININGPTLFPTLFCLLVPLGTLGSLCLFQSDPSGSNRLLWIIPAVTLGLLTAMWSIQLTQNQNLFITIRDHLLLSNPAGRAVNDFYYRNTLFAAEAFKPIYQKTLRTYHLEDGIDENETKKLTTRLLKLDMLRLPQLKRPDMTIAISNTTVVLTDRHGRRLKGEAAPFLKRPEQLLKSFSHISDRYRPLRRMTLFGLLLGFPILLFVGVYTFVRIGMGLLVIHRLGGSAKQATLGASLLCLLVGIGLYGPMPAVGTDPPSNENLPDALTADAWPTRVAALRHIEKQRLELADFPQYKALINSTMPVERYWLARALGASRSRSTLQDLIRLVQDRHPNVQCQAYSALGKRRDRNSIEVIKAHMLDSDHWYTQWYGYRALRRLGWHQALSD
jgi:hypothetical protein